jgi:hypothetical protein
VVAVAATVTTTTLARRSRGGSIAYRRSRIRGGIMTDQDRQVKVLVADAAALIERAAGDLALSEEPAGFLAALEEAAADE